MQITAAPTSTEAHTQLILIQGPADRYADFVGFGEAIRLTDRPRTYVIRLPEEPTVTTVREQAHKFSHNHAGEFTTAVDLHVEGVDPKYAAEFVAGLELGIYRSSGLRSDHELKPFQQDQAILHLVGASEETIRHSTRARALSHVQNRIRALVDTPANRKRPQDLVAFAQDSAKRYGYDCKVLDKEQCRIEGLHALLAVNRGSEDPAQFIILEYKGAGAGAGAQGEADENAPVAIIGKGVTFDTGGVSIKGSQNLHLMKSDMGGAAATFGAVEAAARLALPIHLIGIVPATDNSVDALSIKPSDVIESHAGKTIEIIDTDAEGRLIMADGLSYACQHYAPRVLMNIATLTGSAVRTFGYVCAATLSKNDELIAQFRTAGDACGERVWPLPGWDEFGKGLESDVADTKNYSGTPLHGATDAFKFLEKFTHDHPRYIHFDIAGVALKAGPYSKDRQATGYGVRLLVEWLERYGTSTPEPA